jgi:acetyl esterase/lipase
MRAAAVVLVSLGVALQAQAQGVNSADTSVLRLSYGAAPEQFGELYLPAGPGPFPVAVLIHGGCFVAGMATLASMREFADSLRSAGIATWNVEYRRIGSPDGGWPETYRDVARAADHVRKLAGQFALDTARAVAVGHSAGGFLALWLGAREGIDENSALYVSDPLPLRAVVALGADGDLPPIEPVLANTCRTPVVELLLGVEGTVRRQRSVEANPADMPRSQVPQLLITGMEDRFETPDLLSAYVARARAKGENVEVITLAGAGHFDVTNPKAAVWPTIRQALLRAAGADR